MKPYALALAAFLLSVALYHIASPLSSTGIQSCAGERLKLWSAETKGYGPETIASLERVHVTAGRFSGDPDERAESFFRDELTKRGHQVVGRKDTGVTLLLLFGDLRGTTQFAFPSRKAAYSYSVAVCIREPVTGVSPCEYKSFEVSRRPREDLERAMYAYVLREIFNIDNVYNPHPNASFRTTVEREICLAEGQ